MNDKLQNHIYKVFNSFLTLAKNCDSIYLGTIPEESYHIVYGDADTFTSRKAKRIKKDKKFLCRKLFAPYEYTLVIPGSIPLIPVSHPEAPQIYLDAFLIDNTSETQTIYMMLGDTIRGIVFLAVCKRGDDGECIYTGDCAYTEFPDEFKSIEPTIISLADLFLSGIMFTVSKAKLSKVKSIMNLYEIIL